MTHGQQDSFWIRNFTRWRWPSSVVGDPYLILDGGETTNFGHGASKESPSTEIMCTTILINLVEHWTTYEPKFHEIIDKPDGFSFARRPYMWYNPFASRRAIQSTGGVSYRHDHMSCWFVYAREDMKHPVVGDAGYLHGFSLPDPDLRNRRKGQIPNWLGPGQDLRDASAVATPDTFYAIGGITDNGNPVSEMIKYDLRSPLSSPKNTTSKGFGIRGLGADNQAIFSALFGKQGVIIYIGGYVASSSGDTFKVANREGLQDMTQIIIYDIAGDKFLTQTATLNSGSRMPHRRWAFCAVSASDSSFSTVDMYGSTLVLVFCGDPADANTINTSFIHGGFASGETAGQNSDPTLENIYVLSLPSFVWTEVPRSQAGPRGMHTCQLIGHRQMIVLGGDDPTAKAPGVIPDPWPNGTGIFDTSKWKWNERYNPAAKNYVRAQQLVELTAKQPGAKSWDSDAAQRLFFPLTSTLSSTDAAHSSSGNHTGPIAGGVVSGIAVLALIAAGIFLFLWQKRRKAAAVQGKDQEAAQYSNNSYGIGSSQDPSSPWSTNATTISPFRSGSVEMFAECTAELPAEKVLGELESPKTTHELGPPQEWEIGNSKNV